MTKIEAVVVRDRVETVMEAVEEQGAMPEPANRQMRRLQQRMQTGQPRPGGGGSRKRKRR